MSTAGKHQRTQKERHGGLSLPVGHNSCGMARNARSSFEARVYAQALELDPTLVGRALEKKVALLRSIYFSRLALQSIKTRDKQNRRANGSN